MNPPLATVRASRAMVALCATVALGLLVWGIDLLRRTVTSPLFDRVDFAFSVLVVLVAIGLPFAFSVAVGPRVRYFAGRLEVRAPFCKVQLIGTSQVLGWSHRYRAAINAPDTAPPVVDGLVVFTNKGTIVFGGLFTEGERTMRAVLAGRFPFCDLDGYEGELAYPATRASITALTALTDDRRKRLTIWGPRVGAISIVLLGIYFVYQPMLEQLRMPDVPAPALLELRGTLSGSPRIIRSKAWRANALTFLLTDPDSLAFNLPSEAVASKTLAAFRELRPGDSLTVLAYADELDGSAVPRYTDHQQVLTPQRYEYGRRAVWPRGVEVAGEKVYLRELRRGYRDDFSDGELFMAVGYGLVYLWLGVQVFRRVLERRPI